MALELQIIWLKLVVDCQQVFVAFVVWSAGSAKHLLCNYGGNWLQ